MGIRRVVAAGCLCVAAAFPAAAVDVSALQAGMLSKLSEFRDRYGFPGVTAAVALPDGQIVVAASGLADVEASRAMSPETPMLAASIGKTFVAATVLSLESEGQLSLEGHLADYLGDRPWYPELPNANTITLGHLLHHQSGLPDHPHLPEFQAAAGARIAAGEDVFTPEELLGFVTGWEALFDAGTAWAYSGCRDLRGNTAWARFRPWRLDPGLCIEPAPLCRSRGHSGVPD
jgi:D-alanyl-D-alanine carboxypeptidase